MSDGRRLPNGCFLMHSLSVCEPLWVTLADCVALRAPLGGGQEIDPRPDRRRRGPLASKKRLGGEDRTDRVEPGTARDN